MTYQPAQLQDLIRAIDEVLGKSSPRLPWVMSGEADQQRRILEETRRYLAQMQQQGATAVSSALAHDPVNQGYGVSLSPVSPAESAQQVLQAMLQEMTYLRTTVMQPLRKDLEVLYRQRDRLLQEIHELEAQRQQAVLTDATPPPAVTLPAADQQRLISEFLQTLMGRLQADLSGQVAQMLTEIEAQAAGAGASVAEPHRPSTASETADPAVPLSATEVPALTPAERLQQIQRIQAQSDQLLLKLDNSLRVIFESLQSNIETYQESLSLGLDKMNTLGQQGESIFAAMVNRLAEQLSREASHYLQASIQDAEWQPATSLPQSSARPPVPEPTTEPATEQWPPASLETTASSARPQSDSLDPIDQLLSELEDELTVFQVPEPVSDEDLTVFQVPESDLDEELTVFQVPEPSPESGAADRVAPESGSDPMSADTRPMGSTAYPGLLDEIDDLEALELLTQELERLELASVPELPELEDDAEFASLDDGDEDLTMFQIDESAMTDFSADEPLGDPRTVLQVDAEEAEEDAEEAEATEEAKEAPASLGLSIEDLDSALDLLGQISTQLDAELEQAGSTDGPNSADLTTGSGLDADSVSGTDPYDELDAFYESLFGIDAAGATREAADTADDEPVDQHLSDADQRSLVQPAPDLTDVAEPGSVNESDESDLSGSTDLSDTPPLDAELGSLDSLDQALFGGQADPASDAADATDAAIASPSVDELVDLLSEFMNVPAGEARAGELAEPAEPTAQTESSAFQPPHSTAPYSTERSPEAVEHLLFGESPEPPPAEEPDGGLFSPQPNKPEVIRSLNDLLQLMAAESAEESAVGLPANGLATDAEDRYEPANPGEDLLGGDDVLSSPRPDVQVTQTTLEQLAADLSDLEGLAADAFSTDLAALSSSAAAPATGVSETNSETDSETSSSFTDSLADWGQFPQESLRESPDPFPAAGSAAELTNEGQSYWQGGSFAQNAPTEEDLFISSLFPVEDGSDDEMTLLLDRPPGLSTPLPEKAIAPLTTPESLADWVNALDETELPPDREDLSLSDFQAVMQTEPIPSDGMGAIANVQTPLHPADQSSLVEESVEESLEDSFADDFSDDFSGDFSSDFSGDLLAEDLFSGLEVSGLEGFGPGSAAVSPAVPLAEAPSAAPAPTPSDMPSDMPAEDVGLASTSLDDFSADFAVPASPAPSQGVPALPPDLAPPPAIPNSLEDLFAEVPPAPQPSLRQPSVPPPSDSLPDSILENLSLSVPAPPPGEAAFTLSGLESLFEDLPSVGEVTPVPPPGSPSTNLTAADLTSLLDDAEPTPAADLGNPVNPVDEAQPADLPDSSSEAKKKSSNPPNPREPKGFGRLQPNTRRPQ
ncbi:hypothetical protein [Leptolyngbya sp. O-77]|uniref:hypothetical protein n=1 Tax=Leptolyngbya sp. O-77 TaxID=1080068 RepID=UPI00074D3214|nr:hypothetical protein [Leptolyngbya sp. O-77]BAU43554.1 hypothetical protein O77CONTIG1_03384 [Leptolyngbya sp. O-77]